MFLKIRMPRWRFCQKTLWWMACSGEDSRDVLARWLANLREKQTNKKKVQVQTRVRNVGLDDISPCYFKSHKEMSAFKNELTAAWLLFSQTLCLFFYPEPSRWVCDLDSKLKRVNVDKSTWGLLKIICSWPTGLRVSWIAREHTPALM